MSRVTRAHVPDFVVDGGAVCAEIDAELWFPLKGESPRPAQALCRTCPLVAPCLDYALAHHPIDGVWGGTTDRGRRTLLSAGRAVA